MANAAQQLARHGRTLAKKAAAAGFRLTRAGAGRALDMAFGDSTQRQYGRRSDVPAAPPGSFRTPAPGERPPPAGERVPAPPARPAPEVEQPTASEAVTAERAEARAWRPGDTAASPPDPLLEHVEEEATLAAESADPGAEEGAGPDVTVAEPWDGYDRMRARDVVDRLNAARPDLAGAVRLYEASNKRRKTVLDAAARAERR